MASSIDSETDSTIIVEEPELGSSSQCTSTSPQSLCSRLRAPTASEITWKRKVRVSAPPHTSARKKKPACASDPKGVSVAERAKEFSDKMVTVSCGKLFCSVCHKELSLERIIIKNHVLSVKHAQQKKQVASNKSREREIMHALKVYEQEAHPSGETLPEAHKFYRVKVVSTFLEAGVPLAKLEHFGGLLEEHVYRLSDRRGMSDLIPFIHTEEQKKIKAELQGKKVSVIFDGRTRLGEALVVVLRFVDSFEIKQYLVRFQTLAKSMAGEEIVRELISTLSAEYDITSERLLAAMKDRESVNWVAMRKIKVVFPNMIDVGYYSHTIDLVGEKFHTPSLHTFIHPWISLFSHSPRVRLWWKGRTGKAMSSYSSTLWWSKWEVMHQVMLYFGDIAPFLEENPELSPATR